MLVNFFDEMLLKNGFDGMLATTPGVQSGIVTYNGNLVDKLVAAYLSVPSVDLGVILITPTDPPALKRCLAHIVASNRWGGAERYALDICRHFIDKGWHVAAYTRDAKAVDNLFAEAGVELRHAPCRASPTLPP